MFRWKIAIEAVPFSSGKGAEADAKAAGAEDGPLFFYADGDDIHAAVKMARCFADGIECNPAVWKARVIGIYIERHEKRAA